MIADMTIRSTQTGRIAGAITVSALLHALLLTASAGRGEGGWPASSLLMPQQPLFAVLQSSGAEVFSAADATRATEAAQSGATPSQANADTGGDGSAFGLAAPARYYPARELDVRPQIRSQVEPQYPRSASEQGQAGTVRLRILIDTQGRVDAVSAPGRDDADPFAAAAIAAFRGARYTPGFKSGVAVPSEVFVEVQFESFTAADSFRGGRY
ncbi:MAG: TonB family protein [Betaproteobacteria bacterium]|nr:TonB family protein [Betaproteobacteria bacterium]